MNITHDIDLVTIDDVEDAIQKANENMSQRVSIDSINKRHGAFRDAARLQAIVTIARTSKDKLLQLSGSTNLDATLTHLCSYAPALVGIRLNKSISIGGKIISRRTALEYAVEKINDSDIKKYRNIIKGRTIDLCCISGARKQYLSPLFSLRDSTAVKNNSAMSKTLAEIFKEIGHNDFNDFNSELMEAFGIFTFELFKNTQDHACKDENGIPLVSHAEGIIASHKDLDSLTYKSDFLSHPRLKKYWDDLAEYENGKETLRCIQISFFDTGPGIIGRAFGKDVKFKNSIEEKFALISCLQKNFTTKSQGGAGNGYPTILKQLSKVGGLIKIRTGRQSIFNCFELEGSHRSDNIKIENINHEGNNLFNFDSWSSKELSQAAGTVVSILVPLRKKSGQSSLF